MFAACDDILLLKQNDKCTALSQVVFCFFFKFFLWHWNLVWHLNSGSCQIWSLVLQVLVEATSGTINCDHYTRKTRKISVNKRFYFLKKLIRLPVMQLQAGFLWKTLTRILDCLDFCLPKFSWKQSTYSAAQKRLNQQMLVQTHSVCAGENAINSQLVLSVFKHTQLVI